jgi:hypothetical protein
LAVAADKTPMVLTVFLVLLRLLLVVGVAMEMSILEGILQVKPEDQVVAVQDLLLVLVVRGLLGRVMQVLKGKVL